MARNNWYRKTYSGDLVECVPTVNYIDYLNRMNYGEVGEDSEILKTELKGGDTDVTK